MGGIAHLLGRQDQGILKLIGADDGDIHKGRKKRKIDSKNERKPLENKGLEKEDKKSKKR